ncbi:MAG: hypothetical protein IPJ65_04700 [Archangiaceae bacterium]|nr:hypothetical protein [Archangiaceae bacterium]
MRAASLALLLAALPARAGVATEQLARARQALEAVRPDEALVAADSGLAAGDATPDETANLFWLVGMSSAVLNHPAAAEEAFSKALELAPGLALPAGASPKLVAPVERTRARLRGERLTLEVVGTPLAPEVQRTTVHVRNDAQHLVDRVTLIALPDRALPMVLSAEWTLDWRCDAPPCPFTIEARDAHGNLLRQTGSTAAPLLAAAPEAPPVEPRPFWRRPTLYYVAAGALAIAGAVLGFEFARQQSALREVLAQRDAHTLDEAQRLDAARARTYPFMISAFGGAAVLGIVGTALLVF